MKDKSFVQSILDTCPYFPALWVRETIICTGFLKMSRLGNSFSLGGLAPPSGFRSFAEHSVLENFPDPFSALGFPT